jgi:hypothetical protein
VHNRRVCTTHVLRRCRHGDGSCRERFAVLCGLDTSRCPHAVLCKEVAERCCSPVSLRFGGGAAHVHQARRSSVLEEPARASHQRAGIREKGRWAQVRSRTPRVRPMRTAAPGCSHRRPVRRQVHPLRSMTLCDTCPRRTPCPVSACHPPHALTDGPRSFRLGPGHVCARCGRGSSALPDGSARRARRLQRRPT